MADRKEYTIQIGKSDGSEKNSLTDFGVVCTSVSFSAPSEMAELPARVWKDEDGEDTYIPKKIPIKAYEQTFSLAYTGRLNSARGAVEKFVDYLRGKSDNMADLKLKCGFSDISIDGAYLLGLSDFEYHRSGDEDVLEFKAKFKVYKPGKRWR